ncbi:MAG: F0F1 ATP synthase subunit A [Lachnospiraceae bacterium]|nr:F0F1 ATP synthase subunit A [Lachnospiraceae bacterium]
MELVSTAGAAAAGNDMGFMIKGLIRYELFGQELWITTTHVCMLIIDVVLILFFLAVKKKMKTPDDVPQGLQNVAEIIVEMLDNMVKGSLGSNAGKFANYIGCIFIFILISNISGVFGLRPPTADYGVTLPLGLLSFCIIQFNNIKHNKLGAAKALLDPIPLFLPVNIIGEVAVPISLSLRLFGNVLSGTVMMALVYGLLPIFLRFGIPSVLHVYFDLFAGAIQTYVFCMLTMTYVNDKISDA